jgi:hypothetical protein
VIGPPLPLDPVKLHQKGLRIMTDTGLTREQRKLRSQLGGFIRSANCADNAAHTAPARAAFDARFERQVPAEITDPIERSRRAEALRSAFFVEMALRSSRSRSKAAAARRRAVELDAEADAAAAELAAAGGDTA